MTKQEAIERIGGRKRALSIVGVGCLVPVLLVCGLLFSGVGWVGGIVRDDAPVRPANAQPVYVAPYAPYLSADDALMHCEVGESVFELWRGGYSCNKEVSR